MHSGRLFRSLLSLAFIPAFPSLAWAQSVTAPAQTNPDRIVAGVDKGASTRSSTQNPYGVSYTDCTSDMTLHFTVVVTDFAADTQLAVWAGLDGTKCVEDTARMGTPACWPVLGAPLTTGLSAESPVSVPIDVRVQDLVGRQGAPPADGGYTAGTYARVGIEGCSAQQGFAAVPMDVWFIPVDASGHVVANSSAWAYYITTDLVGPPAPTMQPLGVGDTFLTVNWIPNADHDTAGYDIYRDPPPNVFGMAPSDAQASQLDCPEGGDAADGGCVHVVFGGNPPSSTACKSTALAQGTDGGAPVDDGGASVDGDSAALDSGGAAAASGGGISAISPAYLVPGDVPGDTTDVTVGGGSTGSFTMTGLTNQTWYGVSVAAVDSLGNVGPTSGQKCDFPDSVSDFFDTYRQDGGGAGCAAGSGPDGGAGYALASVLAMSAIAWARRPRRP
jgi:hypothetical protein